MQLKNLNKEIKNCSACYLRNQCTAPVPGNGIKSDLMLVGRNPGINEDRQGIPFVGKGGKYLNALLDRAQIDRQKIWVTNLVKCYSTNDAPPDEEAVNKCAEFLIQEIKILEPRCIVLMGNQTIRAFDREAKSVVYDHGEFEEIQLGDYGAVFIFKMYHPGYLLRQPDETYFKAEVDFTRMGLILAYNRFDVFKDDPRGEIRTFFS